MTGLRWRLILMLASCCGVHVASAAEGDVAFFEKKIRPVLVEHCYKCHSAEHRATKGGLRVDSRDALRKGGDSGPAVVPNDLDESLLIAAVRYDDDSLKMPPKGKLKDEVIADLERWVKMGAPDPRGDVGPVTTGGKSPWTSIEEGRKFWSFVPPKKLPPPDVKHAAWPRDDIDRFILSKLEERGLKPIADADRLTLIRRAYFDLIGLPPTPEQVDEFVNDQFSPSPPPEGGAGGVTNDKSRDAFAKIVDRLLASPHFGERWGRHWLDVARFAESSGGGRTLLFPEAWRYRDYVVEAFNSDRPFNQFVIEQIAGDLLPADSPAQRERQLVATALLVLGPTNYERQDKQILEMDVIDEQLDVIGKGLLGMTITCARCHDHKFDPIPAKDYYALAGILKSTQTLIHDNVSKWVEQPLPASPELEAELKQHTATVASLQEQIKLAKGVVAKSSKSDVAVPAGPPIIAVKDLPGVVVDDEQAKPVGVWKHSQFSKRYIGDGYRHDDNADGAEKTLTFLPELPHAGRYEVRLAYQHGTSRAEKVPVTVFHADGEETIVVNQKEAPPLDGRWIPLGQFRFELNGQGFVIVSNKDAAGHVTADAVQFLPVEMPDKTTANASASPPLPKGGQGGSRTTDGTSTITDPRIDLKRLEDDLKKLQQSVPYRPAAMTVREAEKIGDAFVCIRGNFHNPGDLVPRGFLTVATAGSSPDLPDDASGRRQLADWLASNDNPLTARVFVNRVWHHLFGVGLVRTTDNFGSTGETPSHPELLDHLALRLVKNGWSTKKLIRDIMLSRVYQLASTPDSAGLKADPENRLLGRQNRRRLEVESIRDAILAASGQLDLTVGGPTIRKGTTIEYGYKFDDTRRTLYTPVFRNTLLEIVEVFDFADPNLVIGKRNTSTTAPQALFLMNNPFVIEQSEAAAKSLLSAANLDDAARVKLAYRRTLGRPPTPSEITLAQKFLADGGSSDSKKQQAAWSRLFQALFASVDFRYVD
jgi:hypothetical protein